MLENTDHNVNHNYISYHQQILVQEKYLIRFVQALLCLGGFRAESCRKVHIIN